MTQMTITDWMENEEPICYSCQNALKRGRFRLCKSKGDGYTNTGEKPFCCNYYNGNEEE